MPVRTIAASHVFPVHQANAVTGEVPYWDESSDRLWWTDIQGQMLHGFNPRTGAVESHNLPSLAGVIAGRRSGGLVIGLEDGLYGFQPGVGLGKRLLEVESDNPLTRMNDGKPDAAGRLWFGTMDKTGQFKPIGGLYCLDPSSGLRKVRSDVSIPNGIDFSPDGGTFYFTESHEGRIEACDYDAKTGSLGEARLFLQTRQGEIPDGCCIDAEGGVWIAIVGGARIERRMPDGSLHTVIEVPVSRPTMPMLGGIDGRTLFITCQRRLLDPAAIAAQPLAGDLLAVRVDVPGKTVNLAAI